MITHEDGFTYQPGSLICLARWPICLVTDMAVDDPRMPDITRLLANAESLNAVASRLMQPDARDVEYALMEVEGAAVHLVMHGGIIAWVDSEKTSAKQSVADIRLSRRSQIILTATDSAHCDVSGQSTRLWVANGLVCVSSVIWQTMPSPVAVPTGFDAAATEEIAAPGSLVAASSSLVTQMPDHTAESTGLTDEPADEGVQDSIDVVGHTLAGFDHLFGQATVAVATEGMTPSPSVANVAVQSSDSSDTVRPVQTTAPADDDPGRTQTAISTTALAELREDLAEPITEPIAEPVSPVAEPADRLSAAGSRAARPRVLSGFIDSFDWDSEGIPVVAEPEVPVVAPQQSSVEVADKPRRGLVEEEDEADAPRSIPEIDATVRKDSFIELPGSSEVMVVAFACSRGHYSPPYAAHCRICGALLDQSQAVLEVPRPTLGVLKLWGGGSVFLDRGVIFGRSPRPIPGLVGPEPSLVKIEDPNRDISSQHCEVRLEDWYVTVRDLHSTNGTQVILPHRPPVTLRANDPMALEPGSRVVLANAFDFTFEVGA